MRANRTWARVISKAGVQMTDSTAKGAAMKVDSDLIRQLAELLDASNLSEIEVEDGDRRIRVARTLSAAHVHFSARPADRQSTRLNSSHYCASRMPASA